MAINNENCHLSGNMEESSNKTKDLTDSKASSKKAIKTRQLPKKTGNSIKKIKSKAQTQAKKQTLVGIKSLINNGSSKQEEKSLPKEEETQVNGDERPVKQEFIVPPFKPEEQKIEEAQAREAKDSIPLNASCEAN